jgi:hypothetical protein
LITEFRYQRGRRKRDDEVCSKKAKLNQRCLRVIEIEQALHVRYENVVQARDESDHKKQHAHRGKRTSV